MVWERERERESESERRWIVMASEWMGELTYLPPCTHYEDRHHWTHLLALQSLHNLLKTQTETPIRVSEWMRDEGQQREREREALEPYHTYIHPYIQNIPISPCLEIFDAWIFSIWRRALSLGRGISILRSSRPALNRAGSSVSGRLVAIIIFTFSNLLKPSSWLSSWWWFMYVCMYACMVWYGMVCVCVRGVCVCIQGMSANKERERERERDGLVLVWGRDHKAKVIQSLTH